MLKLLLLLLFLPCLAVASAQVPYAVAIDPAPVLNTSDFTILHPGNSKPPRTDHCGQIRQLEFIALPGTTFEIHASQGSGSDLIYRVTTPDYQAPPGRSLYVEARFVKPVTTPPPPRQQSIPSGDAIISFLKKAIGLPYVWGGNTSRGVRYPKTVHSNPILAGLDCSGLLYEATIGLTPRNTSDLVRFGKPVPVAGKVEQRIAEELQPLDLIVWDGHVVIVLDSTQVIESLLSCGKAGNGGVVVTPLYRRLTEIMKKRTPADEWPAGNGKHSLFVVRRWYPGM